MTIVNMARYQNIVFASLLCVFDIFVIESKIFSKSVGEISLFQQPEVSIYKNRQFTRGKRSAKFEGANSTVTEDNFHSQNVTLNTTAFSLHGVNDNEVFVHWTGENNDTVFVLTRSHYNGGIESCTLWRSTDYGDTYDKADLPENFTVNHMYSSPVSRLKTVLSDLINKRLYITTDTGTTWRTVKLDFHPYRLLLHPTDSNLVLAYSLEEMKLRMSEDFGITWTLLKERVTERFFWGVPGVDQDPRTVHMELQDPIGPVSYHCCIAPNCDPVEYDKSVGTIDFYSLVVENDYVFVQKSVEDNTSLYVSYSRGPFKKALFPLKLHPLDFNVVDTSQKQVLIAVDHEEDIACLYASDVTGQFYIVSVENIVGLRYPGRFDVDLVKVEGFKGVYIINRFPGSDSHGTAFKQNTYITFDNGGTWKPLQAPNETKHLCDPDEECNLHLHIGNTNQFFRIPIAVTSQYAPGLILAHGSVGKHLDMDIHVFISRDAGLTWTQAPFHGNHFLNIMDQGSVISAVLAEGLPTNQVHFSMSEGKDWFTQTFSESIMTVDGVVNEPGKRTLITSLFGHEDTSEGWVMVKMDFRSVFDRKCNSSDIELWDTASSLNDSNNCVMGESFVLERKKQSSHCYFGDDHFRKQKIQPCSCGREDFECDFGYEVSPDSGQCVKSDWLTSDLLPALACRNGKYNRSTGYRKVAASGCVGGEEDKYKPVESNCPLLAPQGLHIVSERSFITRGDNVTFRLSQESGSEDQTMYTWSFDDGTLPVTIQGLKNASTMTRSFQSVGTYNITVLAVNKIGKSLTYLQIHVEDELRGVLVEIPWGVRTGTPSYFNVTVLGSDNFTKHGEKSKLFFAWHFENKVTGAIRQLTWQNVIKQEFKEPGQYILKLEVFNSVSSIFYTQQMDVYEDITTVRLHFSSHIDRYNSSSLNVRQALAEILCHNLAQILEVRRTRIIMTVQPSFPIVADLTVLPAKDNSNESETYKVVQMLIEEAKHQYLAFPLFTNDDIVIITDAGILDLDSGAESPTIPPPPVIPVTVTVPVPVNVTMVQEKHNLVAVYIAVPIMVVVLIIAGAIVIYYRKKLVKDNRYYPIVKHRHRIHHDSTCSCGDGDEENPLGLEDPEFTIIPDSQYTNTGSSLMILNEPVDADRQTDIC